MRQDIEAHDPIEVDDALRAIDRYINEASPTSRSDTAALQLQPTPERMSLSQRLQALGQQKVGTFTPLLDFQNEQSRQVGPTPLLPNEF